MDELQKLYDVLKRDGYYTKSFDEFVTQWEDGTYKDKVYQVVRRDGLYTKDKESFLTKYSSTQPAQQQTTQIQSLTQPQPAKKKEPTVSSSEGGWSDWFKPKQEPQQEYKPTTAVPGTDYNAPQKGPIQAEVEGDDVWYKKGREEKLKELKKYENYQPEYITDEFGNRVKAMQPIAREENLTQPLQKIEQKVKYEEEAKKIQEAAPEEIKSTLKYLDLSKDKSLPDFVSDANYYFNDAGFEFKDAGYNYIEITSPDGEVIQFKYNLGGKEDVENTMAQINNILLKKSAKLKDIYGLDRMYKDENKKFATQYQIDSEFSMLAKEQEALVQQTTTFLKRKQEAEAALKAVNELPMDKRTANYRNDKFQAEQNLKAIYTEAEELQKKIDAIPIKQKNLEIALGKYTSKQEKQGTWVGGIYNSLLSFLDNTVAGSTDIFIDLKTGFIPVKTQLGAEEYEKRVKLYAAELGIDANKVLLPEEYMSKLTDPEKRGAVLDAKVLKEKIDAKIRDDIRKKEKYGTEDELTFMEAMRNGFRTAFGDKSTTEQWEALTKKSFVGGAVLGAAEFVPTMFVPGAWVRRAATYASVNDMVNQEFENNPELRDVSEAEKLYVKIPIGIVGAVLEEYGLKNIIQNTALVKSITGRALLKATEGMTPAVFKKLVSSEVSEMIADGTLKVLGGGIMEFETGAAQQGVDIAVKSIYNASKGKKLFDTPDTVVEVAVDMAVAGAQESIGSVAISTPMVVASAYRKKDIAGIPAEFFDVFVESANDQNIEKGFIATLKNDITAGKITQKEAVDLLNNYRNSVGLLRSVPPELDNADKKKAMTLLRERKELESKTDGKDPALVKPIQERINKINEQLSKLTEDAIQKQTTGEVSVQPEAGAGQEVEVGGPEAKPKITPEESKRKEDLLAALEATDKDVIAIGDELLDRKEAQAELEAITQKEQAPVTEQGGMEQAPAKMSTTEALTSTPTETKAGVTFVAPDGNEVALEGNEQVAAQLYDDAVAVAEDQRTPEQNDIIQKMQPIVTAVAPAVEVTPATEVTPAEVTTTETTATEVTPVEQQFTEQDRARKAELEEAMRKADKRRKNITVGETTMPKAEAKAELDALNQKEQAAQQPVTPTEAAPTATAPVETMTAEQEADLLEELMTGKKKETAPTETAPAEPTSKEAIAKRLRGKKNKGLMSSIDFGISQALYNGALEFMASQVEKGTKLGNAIENTIKWIDEKMQGKSWNKDGFTKYANTTFEEVATKKKAKAILDVYPKGSVVGIADLASESGDTIISNVLSKMKDVFNKVKISGRRPTEGAAFYNYNTKEIDVNKNSPHWDEVEGDQIASALSHEFAHHLIDGHSEKEAIETDLQEIKDDLIANKPELTESQKKAYEFMTSKNNSPQEILTYAVSDPDIRPILTKYKDKLNNISNKLFGEDVISGIFEEQKSKTNEIQPQRTRDGRGRTESRAIAPLEGAPSVQGFVGPDPQLTAVAEEYAKENGIPYKRQAEYVKVDEDRAKRIAEAYEEMKHDPQNPKVKEAYENLIKQTIAQYEALVKAGYKFWFIDTNIPSNLEYAQSPFNAMRDVRSNKQMGVFPTTDGFGSSDVDVSDNPMMAETKFKWPVGGMDGELKPVLANDLFRAVHDAFGHGLEGAGFRARGEENAWQAHIRLFTGSAVGAITSETRGQNSWLNFGPHGEKNRAANTDETIFADQKTGLMPEWTWKEGVAADMETTAKPFATSLADAVRKNLTIKTGGLQSNILGVPIAIWNAGVLTAAKAIDASVAASKAIQQGVNDVKNWIKKNNPSLSLSDAKIKNKILIDLYEGTIKTARENNVKTEGLITYFKRKGLSDAQIDVLLKDEKKKAEKPELSEETLPGYTKLMNRINDIIARGRRNGKTDDDIMKGVIANVESRSPEYANATDQQREQIIRDIRKLFGKKEKAAPSAAKITGKAKSKKVTVDEMTALKDQLRLEAKAAREAKGDINTKRKMLADAINKMVKKGSITVRQAKILIDRVNSVNLDNPVMVERLLDYAEKVFNDAEYADKLSQANDLQSKIKQLSKNKEKFGNLTAFAAEFAKIDPAMVENIDEYIEMASNVKEGVQGSKTVNGKVIPADMVDVGATMEYVNETMKAQEEAIRLKTAERLQELMGVDVSDLSMAKLQELMDLVKAEALAEGEQKETLSEKIDAIFGANKDKGKAIRDGIQRMFDTYSTIIKNMFDTGIDPFSDPDNPTTVEFKDSDKKIVEDFMGMDLSLLDKKEALRAADALNNFLTNKSTAGMVAVFAEYTGRNNNKEVNKEGIKAEQIKMYWSSVLGLTYFQQFASIPLFFERLFKSYKKGRYIREMMGINSLINHKADAVTAANRIINNYVIEFSKKKPNKKAFQDIYNIIERGIIGDLAKTIVGDAKQVEAEFNRRKKLIEETIKILEDAGTKKELEQAKVIKEVYDNIAKDSKTIEEVKEKADQTNVAAVQFWVDQWANLFDQFADVALNVYNKVLDKNVNYVPDRFGFLERAENKQKDADGVESMFFANSNSEYFYKKEAGSLRKSTPPTTLLDSDGNSRDMYVNLSFDTNNANALLEALIDIKTAADIRQIQAFKNDPGFKNIFPFGKDAAATKERIANLIRNIRNKRTITDKTFRDLTKKLDRIAAIGTSLVLAGPSQAISQTLPVAVNTFINSGGKLNLSTISNKDVNRLINESGMGIANRGTDAVTELETLNQKLEVAAKTKIGAVTQYIENLNRAYLKAYLSNFDVFIARASWITYYEKGLKKQGIKGKVDYSTHKLNKEAAQYAQDMIDRQQNISDKDLAGQLYQSDNPLKQLFVKVIMPLTTFRMNQTTRFSNDLAILSSKTSSNEDKVEAAKSLGSFAAEMATFRLTKLYIGYYVFYSFAQFIRGEEEDEEEKKKKWNNMVKGAVTSSVSDVFSPIPQTDMPTKYLFSSVLDQLQALGGVKEEDRFNIFTESKESFASDWGLLGIGIDKLIKLRDNIELARTGKFKDEYGREKTIREEDRKLLSDPRYIGISIATLLGINPFSPETDNVMNNITKMIKKDAMTEKQLEEYKETGEYPTKKSEAVKEKEGASKAEAYGGYKTIEEFEEKDPIKYDEYSAKGGKLYKYREDERKKDEEKNKDQPFRGLSEKQFKEYYPEEWTKYYGPGTAYFQKQNSPAMLQKKEQEKIREAQLNQKRKVAAAKREQQEALKKALGK